MLFLKLELVVFILYLCHNEGETFPANSKSNIYHVNDAQEQNSKIYNLKKISNLIPGKITELSGPSRTDQNELVLDQDPIVTTKSSSITTSTTTAKITTNTETIEPTTATTNKNAKITTENAITTADTSITKSLSSTKSSETCKDNQVLDENGKCKCKEGFHSVGGTESLQCEQNKKEEKKSPGPKLGGGAIAGIVISGIIVLGLISFGVYFTHSREMWCFAPEALGAPSS